MAKVFYWLLPFYLMSFVASTAGEEIFGWAIVLLFLIHLTIDLTKSNPKKVLRDLKIGADLPILFFGVWALLNAFLIYKDGRIVWDTFSGIRWIFLLYGISYLFKKYFNPNIKCHFNIAMASTALVGLYGFIQMFTRIDLIRPSNEHMSIFGDFYRATGFHSIPLTYAYCLGMVGIFAFTKLLLMINYDQNKKNYILPILATVFTIAGIIASSTRGAWIAFFVAIMALTYVMDRKKAVLVFVFSLLVAGPMMFEPTIQKRAMSIFDLKNQASNTERISLWRANFEMFKDSPIQGVGLDKGRHYLGEYYQKLNIKNGFDGHAHNDFLQILSGTGLPGAIAWLLFSFYFLKLSYRLYRSSTDNETQLLSLGALGAQIYFFVGGLTQCNFSDNEVNHILIFIWALLAGIHYQKKNLVKD